MWEKIMEYIKQRRWKAELRRLDENWYLWGSCFDMYPPSFYLTHTPEEVEKIQAEDLKRIKQKIEELKELEPFN